MRPLEFVIPLLLAIYLLVPPPRPFIIRILPTGALAPHSRPFFHRRLSLADASHLCADLDIDRHYFLFSRMLNHSPPT